MKQFLFHTAKPKSQLFIVKQDNSSLGHINPQSINMCEALLSNILPELQTENENYSDWFLFV